MNNELSKVEKLALSIATCNEIKTACQDEKHPCREIVSLQDHRANPFRQSPEPWAGNLEKAPLLFVSSNPSISEGESDAESFPNVESHSGLPIHFDWSVDNLVDFHTNRFDQSREKPFVKSSSHYLCKDGEYRGPVKYWREVFKLAKFIFGKEIDISNDLCLTEVVHCKSKGEIGVNKKSRNKCAENYMSRILQASNAKMVVCYGAQARAYFTSEVGAGVRTEVDKNFGRFSSSPISGVHHLGILEIGSTKTLLCALKHNSGRGGNEGKTFESALGKELANSFATLYQAIVKGAEPVPESREALLKRLGVV
jgi:hypothetical protein